MYRVYKKEHFQKRPKWIIPLLLDISPRDFIQEDMEGARRQLDAIEEIIGRSEAFRQKGRYRVERGEDYVAIVNEGGTPYLSYRIKEFEKI